MTFFQSSIRSYKNNNDNVNEDFFDKTQQKTQHFFSTQSHHETQQPHNFFGTQSQNASTIFSAGQTTIQSKYFNSQFVDSQHQSSLGAAKEIFLSTLKENQESAEKSLFEESKNNSFNDSISLFNDTDEEDRFDDLDEANFISQYSPPNSLPGTPLKTQSFNTTLNVTSIDCDVSTLPESIMNLFKEIKKTCSDFTFTSIIAGQLCTEMFPMGSYNYLKMSLLMSLVTSPENKLHIMAVGQETSHASIIMNFIGKFAQRFLRVTSNYDAITVNNNQVIEGGALTLASNGIAFFGNWQTIPQKPALKLLREIETKTILVDKIQKNYPLETTVWAYWNFTSKHKKDLASINQFINVFGLPIIIDDEIYCEDIIDDMLNQALTEPFNRINDFQIPESDFRLYISHAQNLSVEFDEQAHKMLKNYFMATKIIRPDALSEKGYETIKMMAESHAKLSLRKTVERQDVLAAISIAEKFIKEFFEKDSFTSPSFSIDCRTIDCYDKFMSDLYQWYVVFTKDILEKM